ncbi:MAG: Ig-like domain-containing protein [Candidatus Thermoplasmatota archaeon]|nr:Ig-like domain-containing protein [Candidatus Thermoplasmatota archaeon]
MSGIIFPSIGAGYTGEITTYPEEIEIVTNVLTGSEAVSFWSNQSMDSVNITVLNTNTTTFLNEEVSQDDVSGNNFYNTLTNATYSMAITVNDTQLLDIHIKGHSDAPDLDLGICYDANGNGTGEFEELINTTFCDFISYASYGGDTYNCTCADADADEKVRLINPPNGTYIIKVLGYTVSSIPGHFDLIIDRISEGPGIFNVTGTNPAALPLNTLGHFNLTWELPGGSPDGEYTGGMYIGTDSEYNITLVPISLIYDTQEPDVVPSFPAVNQDISNTMPTILVNFDDSDFGRLDGDTARLWLDGIEVTSQSSTQFLYYGDSELPVRGYLYGSITYTQKQPLNNGAHTLTAEVCDQAGNMASESWIFTVNNPYQLFIQHIPEVMNSVNYVTPIEALVESDFGIASVDCFWKLETNLTYTQVTMNQTGINRFYSEIPAQTTEGILNYYLRVEDADGMIITSPDSNPDTEPYEILINAASTPRVTHLPSTVYGDEPLEIDAVISDDQSIEEVLLYYRISGALNYNVIQMNNGGTGHHYSADIDTDAINPNIIEYYILASDGVNNVTHPVNVSEPHSCLYSATFVPGGDLRIAMPQDVKSLNPLIGNDEWSTMVLDRIYGKPIERNPYSDEIMPYIAVGSANTSLTVDVVDWSDCDVGNFGFTPRSTWGMEMMGSNNGEAIVFYDFTNVTWHDDIQMDVRDIMFSYHVAAQIAEWTGDINCLKDNGGGTGSNYSTTSWLYIFKVWESADHMKAALKFVMTDPYADFFKGTLAPVLLPEHIWAYTVSGQNVDGTSIWCDPWYDFTSADSWKLAPAQAWNNSNPVGSDTFEFVQRTVGDVIELDTWRDHFFTEGYAYGPYVTDYSGGSYAYQPNIDSLTFKIYFNLESELLALKNDNVDFIAQTIHPMFVQELLADPGVDIMQTPEQSFTYLGYNMRRQSFGYDTGASYPYAPGDDPGKSFRKAVAHCLDKNRIVQILLQNYGIGGEGPISPMTSWYNNTIPRYSFDPNEAKNILANAGYKVFDGFSLLSGQAAINAAGPGNWWLNPDGSQIGSGAGGKIEILTPEANFDPVPAQSALMIAQQLRNVGIYAESISLNLDTLSERLEARDFDMCVSGYKVDSEPPNFLYDYFYSLNEMSGQNYVGYQNVDYDTVIDLARSTGDENMRMEKIRQAQGILADDLPLDVLYFRTRIEAYRSDEFTGWCVGPSASIFNDESLKNIRHPLLAQSTLHVGEKEFGGNFRVALESEPNTINPLAATKNETASKVIDLIYDSLARVDPCTLEIIPWVAEDWNVSPDNLTVTVTVCDNITWHNGSVLTSVDVKHTFDTYALPYISSVNAIDNLTVEFNLASPDARFFSEALLLPLFPLDFDAASQENGCGPFKFKETVSGDYMTLECNENYFKGRANVGSITFTYYPYIEADFSADYPYSQIFSTDPRWQGSYRASYDLIAGKLDFIGWDLTTSDITWNIEISGNNTNLLMNPSASVVRNPGMKIQHIGFNTQQSPLNDTILRVAIAQAMNNEGLTIYDISGGLQKTDTLISQGNIPYWNNSIPDRGDMEYANYLLDEAGYFDRNGDGWRQLPYAPYDDFNITLLGPNLEDVTFYTMATNIITWLHQLGINASFESNTTSINWAKIINGDYDMYFYSLNFGVNQSILSELAESGSPTNYANYADATMDSMLEKMNTEMNGSLRCQYVKDCEGYLSETVPYVPLFHYRVNNAYRTESYAGWASTLGGIDNFWSYINVYPLFDPTPVDAPNGPFAYNPMSGCTINLTWAHNDENGLTGYNIYRSNVSGGPYQLVESVGLVTSYQDTTVEDQVNYYYVITGFGPESEYSAEVTTRSGDGVSPFIVWTAPANGTLDVNVSTGISGLFSESMNQTSVEDAFRYSDGVNTWTSANGTFVWTDNDNFTFTPNVNLSFNTTFDLTIDGSIAKDLAGNSLDGNADGTGGDDYSWEFTTLMEITDTSAPVPPTNLTVTDPGTGGVLNISWTTNSEPDLAGYKIYRSLISGTNYTMIADVGMNITYQDTGLIDNTTYYYVISAYDDTATPNESNYSDEASGVPTSPVEEILTGTISGRVLNESGDPLENVTITLGDTEIMSVTDADGRYTLINVSAGNWTLAITCQGYITQNIDIVVEAGEVTEIPDVILVREETINEPTSYWFPIMILLIIIGAITFVVYIMKNRKTPLSEETPEEADKPMETEPEAENPDAEIPDDKTE